MKSRKWFLHDFKSTIHFRKNLNLQILDHHLSNIYKKNQGPTW